MKNHYLTLAVLGALSLCMQNCANDDTLINQSPDSQSNSDGVHATLTLTAKDVGSFAQSRASWAPTKEAPSNNEGKIDDVLVIIYKTSFNSANLGDASADEYDEVPVAVKFVTVSETGTVTSEGSKIYQTAQFVLPDDMTAGDYNVFVIANPDYRPKDAPDYGAGCNAAYFENKKLREIRNDYYTGALYRDLNGGDISKFDRFIMTSDIERSFTLTQEVINNRGTVDISAGKSGETNDSQKGPILVERLAARIDVSFGTDAVYKDASSNVVTLNNGTPSATVSTIELPVYDYTDYMAGVLTPTPHVYVINDIDVLNVVNNRQLYIQRSNSTYFRDENWTDKTGNQTINGVEVSFAGTYAANTVSQAGGCEKTALEDHTLAGLILKKNNLYSDEYRVPFYTLGYYRENISNENVYNAEDFPTTLADIQQGKTAVKISGTFHKAADLLNPAAEIDDCNFTFHIMHCHLNSGVPYPRITGAMSYAIGRNTIYRLRIDKILADGERVYVRWYYDSDNNGTFENYTNGTPFGAMIVDGNATPND